MKNELITAGVAFFGTIVVAWLTWRLTEYSRDQADRKKDRAVAEALLASQSEALILAVVDLQTAATTNRVLWETPWEKWRSFCLAAMAGAGGYARADTDVPQWRRFFSAAAELSRVVSTERIVTKTAAAELKTELSRLAAATVPLMRHPNADIRTATGHVLRAATNGDQDAEPLDNAMAEFSDAVSAVLPSWTGRDTPATP